MNKIDRSFWQEQISQLPFFSQKYSSYTEFINAALQNIAESLGLKRATYLTCVLEEGRIVWDVSAETFPADRDFVTRKSSELRLFLVNIILEGANKRYMEKTLTIEGEQLDVKAFQICLPESNTQHIFVLTFPQQGEEGLQLSEDDKKAGFEYLAGFAETAASMTVKT